jgi:hypothetical protein
MSCRLQTLNQVYRPPLGVPDFGYEASRGRVSPRLDRLSRFRRYPTRILLASCSNHLEKGTPVLICGDMKAVEFLDE